MPNRKRAFDTQRKESIVGQDIIFVGGSIVVKTLPVEVARLLDIAMDNEATFVIGDAAGADLCAQKYLAGAGYKHVSVYAMNYPRNLVGNWPFVKHKAPPGVTGSAWHAVKDRAMDQAATSGIMIWNGSSSGTRNNVLALLGAGKPCTVWTPEGIKTYHTLEEFKIA